MSNSGGIKGRILAILIVVTMTTGVFAGRGGGRGPLQVIPKETLFCVRFNNFNQTCDALTDFFEDIAEDEDVDVKGKLLEDFSEALGGERPRGIRMNGSFTLFAVDLPSEEQSPNPFKNIFVGVMMPLWKWENFILRNPNVRKPDEQGIAMIAEEDEEEFAAAHVSHFVVVTKAENREKLIRVRRMMNRRGPKLRSQLDEVEKQVTIDAPIWLYVNVAKAYEKLGPMLEAQLEGMKMMMSRQPPQQTGITNPAALMDFYGEIIKMMLEGTDHLSIAIEPDDDAARFTLRSNTVEGSLLSRLMVEPAGGDLEGLLGYLDNGAFCNLVGKIGKDSMRLAYNELIDLMAELGPDTLTEADVAKMRELTKKSINAIGDTLAISIKAGGDASLFSMKYILEVSDEQAFEQAIEQELEMIKSGMINKFYKGLGMDLKIDAEWQRSTYKGVQISSAVLKFQIGDADSEQNEALQKMWGEGLKYNWAVLEGYAAYSMGSNTDEIIRTLIDQIRTGGPDELASEIEEAIDLLGEDKEDADYDFGGTVNVVRLMNLAGGFVGAQAGADVEPMNLDTDSNVVFAGNVRDGVLQVETVVPKEHIIEVKAAGEEFGKKMQKAMGMKASPGHDGHDEDHDHEDEHEDHDDN